MATPQKILLVGCGKMGSALLAQWKKNPTYQIFVLDPTTKGSYASLDNLPVKQFNIIVLAVKPQVLDEVLGEITTRITASLFISIAAGKTLKHIEDILSKSEAIKNPAIIRAMPNTPALVGKGITVSCPNKNVTPIQRNIAKTLLEISGKFEWIEDEKLMDAVTALSGSGPAYVFLLIEELTKAGVKQGLSPELSAKLARQTVIGSAALAEASPDVPAATLRQNVTSPGGTTEAALNILMAEGGLSPLIAKAISTAAERSRELDK